MRESFWSRLREKTGVAKKVQSPRLPSFEPLEPRLLLNADLTGVQLLPPSGVALNNDAVIVDLDHEENQVPTNDSTVLALSDNSSRSEPGTVLEPTLSIALPAEDPEVASARPDSADGLTTELNVQIAEQAGVTVSGSAAGLRNESRLEPESFLLTAAAEALSEAEIGIPGLPGLQSTDPDIDTSWINGDGPSALVNLGDGSAVMSAEAFVLPDRVTSAGPVPFNVYVEPGLLPAIQTAMSTYTADLTAEGYEVTVQEFVGDAAALRAELQTQWQTTNLEGALFVGDLPYVMFTSVDNFESVPAEVTYPHDLYFMDLNGTYVLNSTGPDEHLHGSGDVGPEMYVSRITTSNLSLTGRDEATLINQYFAKVHAYRTGALTFADRGIVFADDDWSYRGGEQMDDLYGEVLAINSATETTRAGYLGVLAQDYESILECIHSNSQAHALKVPVDQWEWLYSWDVLQANPRQAFYNMFNCSGALFTALNNLIGTYVYGGDYGLNAVGSTKTGSMLGFPSYYHPQSLGASLGQAFMDWFNLYAAPTDNPAYNGNVDWFYGMTMQGDPTLRPRAGSTSPIVNVSGNGIEISDGDTTPDSADGTDFGSVLQGGAAISHTFTVRNVGTVVLTLGAVAVPTGFTLTEGLASSLDPGASDTFTVQLDTPTLGTKSGEITFSNDDADKNPFNFAITGTVVSVLGDPNDQISEALTTSVGSTVTGTISPMDTLPDPGSDAGDVDLYQFTVAANAQVGFDLDLTAGSGLDSYIRLFDSSGTLLAYNDDRAGPAPEYSSLESYLEYTFMTAGTYYLGVSGFANGDYSATTGDGDVGGSTGGYTLRLNDLGPATVTVSISPLSVYGDGATNLVYTFTRSVADSSPLTVNFSVGGTATFETDYTQSGAASFNATSGTVVIGADQTTATVMVDPTADTVVEPDETVILTVIAGTGYTVGTPSVSTGTIQNDDASGNLALGRTAVASTSYTGFPASNATDGNTASRWSSEFSDNEWIYVDLGSIYTIKRVVLRWEAAYGRGYTIQVSSDASTWSDAYSTTMGDGGVDDITLASPISGRYVRMLGTQRGTQWGYSLYELEVYGAANLALGKTAVASTSYTGFPASNATDGNTASRWSSEFSDNEWIYVDLGSIYTIRQIVLRWETAYGLGYLIQVSDDASTWSDVYSTTTGDGGVDDITLASPVSCRYVRMLGTQRGTQWGYSLWEFEVYG